MLMDLTCPAEFRSVEVLRDAGGRAQAYLTFFNLSEANIQELGAMVTMLGEDGVSRGIRPLRYELIDAPPKSAFTLCMVMDDLPFFVDARVTIQRVGFQGGTQWHWDKTALIDCTPKELAPGPQRVALVAIAGKDAICWPQQREGMWVCVCGRFNLNEWGRCRRCQRDRKAVFEQYQLQKVMLAYQEKTKREIAAEREARQHVGVQKQQTLRRRQREFERRLLVIRRRQWWRRGLVVALALLILAVALLVPRSGGNVPAAQTPDPMSLIGVQVFRC